jgi:FKBP-type peptidyl-prolyl cis-trans isomerase FklB
MGIADKLSQMKNEKAAANLKAGQDFLEENKKKPGVTVLPSGLQYEVITQGTGPKPSASNNVTCHYHGTLIDGTVFDSSVKRGQPATFPLNAVIKGWTEGLQLMPTGSKWRFFIPPQLAYGERQVSAQIGANSTLIFEVELLGIS